MSEHFTCRVCGNKHELKHFAKPYDDICSMRCWSLNFWKETIDNTAIIINGNVYHAGKPDYGFKGFDGRRFSIRMNDGEIIHTDCLWYNGVPSDDGIVVTDNARFINDWYTDGKDKENEQYY